MSVWLEAVRWCVQRDVPTGFAAWCAQAVRPCRLSCGHQLSVVSDSHLLLSLECAVCCVRGASIAVCFRVGVHERCVHRGVLQRTQRSEQCVERTGASIAVCFRGHRGQSSVWEEQVRPSRCASVSGASISILVSGASKLACTEAGCLVSTIAPPQLLILYYLG